MLEKENVGFCAIGLYIWVRNVNANDEVIEKRSHLSLGEKKTQIV